MVTVKDMSNEKAMWGDIYNLRKKYYQPDLTDEQYTLLLEEATAIHKKYGETRFCHDLLWAVLDEYERVEHGLRENMAS